MAPINPDGYTRDDLLDEIERNTGVRPDIKQAMLNVVLNGVQAMPN